ncbi:hypothetical protein, partial [Clostridium tarantellae]|uniref:hypothetical protein n=1 Tax=Clostridium tarantellae TaxID=39493 RepID=UPI001A9B046B
HMKFETDKELNNSNFFVKNVSESNNFNSEIYRVNSINDDVIKPFNLNVSIFQAQLLNGAKKLDKYNFIGDIGGPNDGAFMINVNVPYSCLYFLAIKYICTKPNLKFKVSINNITRNLIFSPKYLAQVNTSEILIFTFPIVLNARSNIIKFHGDGSSFAPYLGDFTLSLPPLVDSFHKGILEGDASIEPNKNFVNAIGGPSDGAVTVTVKVNTKGVYNLTFQYDALDKIRPLKIDINGIDNGEEYILPLTNGINANTIKTFNVLVNLNEGINTLRFHGDGINYGPSLGKFTVNSSQNTSTALFSSVAKTYNITSGIVGNGAVIDKKLKIITNIGGIADGFCIITIPVESYGIYLMKIYYVNNNRPLKIDINGLDTGKIYTVNGEKSGIFSVTIPLVVGINTLRFHGDKKNLSPDLGSFTLELIKNNFTSDFNGDVLSGAKILSEGVITGLGGVSDGKYMMDYDTKKSGKYILNITLDTSKGNILLIDINGENTGFTYNIPKSSEVIVYTIIISLQYGDNTIVFHGNYINKVPDILKIEINLAYAIEESIYKLSDGILVSGATLDPDSNFIEKIGGINNGNVTVQVNADKDGMYNLNVKYIENEVDNLLKIDVNNISMEGILISNDLEDGLSFQNFNIDVPLKKGINSIKFYGNGVDKVSKLGDISIKEASMKESTTFTKIYKWDKAIISEDLKKASWNDEEITILGNGASFFKSNTTYIVNIGGVNRGGAIIDINIPKSDDYILTLNYLSPEMDKKLLIDFNYANNPQVITLEKSNVTDKKELKTLQIKISLALGKNTIIFSGDGSNFAPSIGDFTISEENKNKEDYKIVSQELKRGAKEIQNGDYITAIGGKNRGFLLLTINVKLAGQYDLGIKYTSPELKRSLKIKINEKLDNSYMFPETDKEKTLTGASFTIPLNLIAGSNTVEIKGNGNILTPNIGQFTLALSSINSIIVYDIASGVLKNGARVNKERQVCNIGGPRLGEVSIKVTVPFKGLYDLDIEYDAVSEEGFLELLVNDISVIRKRQFLKSLIISTLDLPKAKFKVNLEEGINILKFRGEKNSYAPKLGSLKLRVAAFAYIRKLPEGSIDITKGLLGNGAGIDYEKGLVVNLGGRLNGFVTMTVESFGTGDYSMILHYRAKNMQAPLLIDINEEEDGNIYILDETGNEIGNKAFTIALKHGNNTIKFYGDKNDDAPDLRSFLLTPLFKVPSQTLL